MEALMPTWEGLQIITDVGGEDEGLVKVTYLCLGLPRLGGLLSVHPQSLWYGLHAFPLKKHILLSIPDVF